MKRPLYYDADTGIDDSMALIYLASSPEISFVGMGTVCGNIDSVQAAENSLRLLDLMDRGDVPVAIGAKHFLTHPYTDQPVDIHGANGVRNVDLPETNLSPIDTDAPNFLIELSKKYEGELEVVAVGPLTNLALAVMIDPELPKRVKRLTVMGGAAQTCGNASPVGEANIWNDPEAANIVLQAGWEVTLVGLDITLKNILEEDHRHKMLESDRPVARYMGEMLDLYFNFYLPQYGRRCSALHDPLAAAIAVGNIQVVDSPWVPVIVDDTNGPGRGQTIGDYRGQLQGPADAEGARTRMVLATDRPLADHLTNRILGVE